MPCLQSFDLLGGHLDGIVWRVTLAPNGEPVLFGELLDRLATIAIASIRSQLDAGAAAFQLFDSWAGALDAHIHFICPQQVDDALMSGVTTMLGGGTGPAAGTNATTCTPGPWNIARMLQAAEALPMNLGFLGKGNASQPDPLTEQIAAGAMGLKLHEYYIFCTSLGRGHPGHRRHHQEKCNQKSFHLLHLSGLKRRIPRR